MKTSDKPMCCKIISDGGMGFYTHQCSRKAVVTVDGKPYCRQHSPDAKKRRDELSDARYAVGSARYNARWETERLGLQAIGNRDRVVGIDFSAYDAAMAKLAEAEARLKELEDKP